VTGNLQTPAKRDPARLSIIINEPDHPVSLRMREVDEAGVLGWGLDSKRHLAGDSVSPGTFIVTSRARSVNIPGKYFSTDPLLYAEIATEKSSKSKSVIDGQGFLVSRRCCLKAIGLWYWQSLVRDWLRVSLS
jgi:hypothetical protein